MIHVDAAPGAKTNRLLIKLENSEKLEVEAVKSLLTASYSPKLCGFLIGTEDFSFLEAKLETLGIADQGHLSADAQRRIEAFVTERDQFLKLRTTPATPDLLQKIPGRKTDPYPDQLQCAQFHIARRRSLEAGQTGLGKSLTLLLTYLYWRTQGAKQGVVFCLNSGKLDWESEVKKHTHLTPFIVGNGTAEVLSDLRRYQNSNSEILIVHYDVLLEPKIEELLTNMSFGWIGLDESHILKNPMAKRHKAVMRLVQHWKDVPLICATGTAIDGNPKSAWAILKIIESRPDKYFPSYNEFYDHFVKRQVRFFGTRRVMVEIGFKNLGTLKDRLSYTSIRFLKSEVMNRPSKIFQTRIVQMKGAQLALYTQVKKAIRADITTEDNGQTLSLVGVTSKLLRLRQIMNNPLIIEGLEQYTGAPAKYEELDEILDEILSHEDAQILVWTQWRKSVEELVKRYKNYHAVAFYGGSDDYEIRNLVVTKKARVVVAIPEKAATSIDWLKGIRTAVYLEKPWSLSLYRQSLDRIDRRTNTDPALIISIECANSVDQMVNAMLKRRQNVFDSLTIDDDKLVAMNKAELLDYLK